MSPPWAGPGAAWCVRRSGGGGPGRAGPRDPRGAGRALTRVTRVSFGGVSAGFGAAERRGPGGHPGPRAAGGHGASRAPPRRGAAGHKHAVLFGSLSGGSRLQRGPRRRDAAAPPVAYAGHWLSWRPFFFQGS